MNRQSRVDTMRVGQKVTGQGKARECLPESEPDKLSCGSQTTGKYYN